MYLGVDGTPDGWLAVAYDQNGFVRAGEYASIARLWSEYDDRADSVLIDVPIGLRESSNTPRNCDRQARNRLGSPRSSSVFPPPVRPAIYQESYQEAKAVQEERTDGSLGTQTWAISDKIRELDRLLVEIEPGAAGTIREAHPEICFWALANRRATRNSKTGKPAAAFWERVEILERIDPDLLEGLRQTGLKLETSASNDDLIDAFVLAVTASPLTGPLQTLPDDPPTDPKGLPMEMVFAEPLTDA